MAWAGRELAMSDSAGAPEGAENFPDPQAPRVSIVHPYSISNMVFFQAAPLWLCLVLGTLGVAIGGAGLLRGAETRPVVLASAALTVFAVVGLLVLRYALWQFALRGYTVAVAVVYAFHAILVFGSPLLLPVAAFLFSPSFVGPGGDVDDRRLLAFALTGLVALVVFGLIWLLALTNLLERGFWRFAALDGRCPVCRKWRFGRIQGPTSVRCAQCGAQLEFCRRDQQRRRDEDQERV